MPTSRERVDPGVRGVALDEHRPDTATQRARSLQLVAFAAASLHLELSVIRFSAAEIVSLGWFTNFILLSTFVGLGLGFFAARRSERLANWLPSCLLFLVAFVLVSHFEVGFLKNKFGLHYFGGGRSRSGLPDVVLLPILFIATASLFAGIGQQVGRLFACFDPLRAYSLDVGGSLLGIALFSLQSWSWSGPTAWFATASFLLIIGFLLEGDADGRRTALHIAVAGCACAILTLAADPSTNTIWSTYQRLEYRPNGDGRGGTVFANGAAHQTIMPAEVAEHGWYGAPYAIRERLSAPIDDVLIIGAGSGTDVAVALRHGVKSVDAVEIDPGIYDIGARENPDHPYQDPRVTTHLTDGREFLRSSPRQYDLIVFALPDSLIQAATMSEVRLESYLFTVEAFEEAKRHLKPNGTFFLYNQYRWDWLKHRIAAMLENVFGQPPLAIDGWATASAGTTTVFAAGSAPPGDPVDKSDFAGLAHDDWPFLYLQRPGIHWLYLAMIGMFLLASLAGVALIAPAGTLRRFDGPFFFMGAAFLLLETKGITFFALLFGSTWLVNSLVFAAVLVSVLAANLVVQKWRPNNRPILFVALFLALAIAWLCPAAKLLDIASPIERWAAGGALVFSPIFLANLIFSREFAGAEESARAFGWNLLGTIAGGGLEYLSLRIGNRNLLILVAALYACAGLGMHLARRRASLK